MRTLAPAIAGLFLLLAPAAGAAPTTRDAAIAAYAQVQADGQVASSWTGSTAKCTNGTTTQPVEALGTESQASIDATARTVNTLRDFAGLSPITMEAERSRKALLAALMMKAQNTLSHSPDPSFKCYSDDGKAGAGNSNLFLGLSGPPAMVGYVDDSGVSSLGHRFWLLDPWATTFGTGSTGTTNALWVVDSAPTPQRQNDLVTWPPKATYVPRAWVFKDWSLDLPPAQRFGATAVNLANAQVAVSVDGVPAAVSAVTPIANPYGQSTALKWQVALPASFSRDAKVDVAVTGATVNGAPSPISYSTTILGSAAASTTPAPTPAPVATPTPTPSPSTSAPLAPSVPKTTTVGSITATIRTGKATRGGKVSVAVTGLADGKRLDLAWVGLGSASKRCKAAARRVSGSKVVRGGKARTTAPRCRGSFRLTATASGIELIRRTIKVR